MYDIMNKKHKKLGESYMSSVFELCGRKFYPEDIKAYYVLNKEYVYRPVYVSIVTMKNKLTHNIYTFESMEPYLPYTDNISLDQIPYKVINTNDFVEEIDRESIKVSTKTYHEVEIRTVQCLVIVTDKENYFYDNVDISNVFMEYNRLKFFMKSEKSDSKNVKQLNNVIEKSNMAVKWYKGLSRNKRICITVTLFIFLFSLIIGMGEGNNENTTTSNYKESSEYVANIDETQIQPYTTNKNPETTEKVSEPTTELTVESTTEYITESISETTVIKTTAGITKKITEKTTVEETEKIIEEITEETTKKGRTVYITPYGEKYHYSASCAGKNAMARTLDEVKGTYDPCKKCAQ